MGFGSIWIRDFAVARRLWRLGALPALTGSPKYAKLFSIKALGKGRLADERLNRRVYGERV
jgi:hypothetical protein